MVNTEGLILFGAGSEWFWSMLQFVVVTITLAGIYVQLRQGRAGNAFAQVTGVRQEWFGERLTRRRLAICLALRDGGPDADLSRLGLPILDFREGVAALVRARHVELAVIHDELGTVGLAWWSILEPAVRRHQGEHTKWAYAHFEWLAGELRRRDDEIGEPADAYDRERMIAGFIQRIPGQEATLAEFEAMRTMTLVSPPPADVVAPAVTDVGATASS